MPRLNDEDRLKNAIHEYVDKYGNIEMSIVDFNIMLERNRVEAEPVRHGHWEDEEGMLICSLCGRPTYDMHDKFIEFNGVKIIALAEPDYCSFCGAKMDEEEER